jgi:ABC-type transport system substrate-binding protein
MMKKYLAMVFILAFSLSLLSGFALAAGPKDGGTLRFATRIPQYNRLDPRYPTTSSMVPTFDLIYERLFEWDKDGFNKLIPRLATSYYTDDAKVWTIYLRKGVKFHNGREMTAEDVKANLDWRINLPKGWRPVTNHSYLKYLSKVEVVNKYEIKMILDKPFAPLMRVMTFAFRGVAPPEEVEKWQAKFSFHPSGTGPFKVVEIKEKQKISLERFEDYWGPRPHLDRVEAYFMRSNDARLIALQKGEIDFTQLYDESRPTVMQDPNLLFEPVTAIATMHKKYFNVRRWPMSDVRFRKAFWMGADWKNISINSGPYKSGQWPRTILDRSKYFNPEAMKLVPKFNPEEAKRLIKQVEKDAGKKIPPIYYLDSNSPSNKAVAEMAKYQLHEVGIRLNLQLMSHAIWFEMRVRDPKLEWHTGAIGYGFAEDPGLGFIGFFTNSRVAPDGKSLGGYSNPEFDRWVMKAESSLEMEDQIKAYQEAEKILIEDAAAIPVFFFRLVMTWNKKVKGVVNHTLLGINVYNSYSNLWIDE